jgi:hypothetical protein
MSRLCIHITVLGFLSACSGGDTEAPQEDTVIVEPPAPSIIRYSDASGLLGLGPLNAFGVALVDYDEDGWVDVTIAHENGVILMRGSPGAFIPDNARAGMDQPLKGANGVIWADVDDDGDLDLFVTRRDSLEVNPKNYDCKLFLNDGKAHFTMAGDSAGLSAKGNWKGAAMGDLDGDGDLDLVVLGGLALKGEKHQQPPSGWGGTPNKIYFNNGDGTFKDVSDTVGCRGPDDGEGHQTVLFDFERDGDLDIFITNDFRADTWCRNSGGGTFEDVSPEIVPSLSIFNHFIMGMDLGDFNGDGCMDLYATNFGPDLLYTGTAELGFWDAYPTAIGSGIDPTSMVSGWGTAALDADHDGDQDLISVSAYEKFADVSNWSPGAAIFLENRNGVSLGGLIDVGSQVNDFFGLPLHAFGLAAGDIDNDMDLDVLIGVYSTLPKGATPPRGFELAKTPILLKNDTDLSDRHAIFIKLEQAPPNRRAVGATVIVSVDGKRTARVMTAGTSYLSQHAMALHFGLGESQSPDWVSVQWPGGHTQVFTGLSGSKITLTRGQQACVPAGSCRGITTHECVSREAFPDFKSKECKSVCARAFDCGWGDMLQVLGRVECMQRCIEGAFHAEEMQCIIAADCGPPPECLSAEPERS